MSGLLFPETEILGADAVRPSFSFPFFLFPFLFPSSLFLPSSSRLLSLSLSLSLKAPLGQMFSRKEDESGIYCRNLFGGLFFDD